MATYKYLDSTGLGTVWGKIKNLIPHPDWNENSSSSPNFIENRTHWREISGTVVAEEQTPTVDDYTYINYDNTFSVGDSVTVIYNGTIYSGMEAVNIGDFPTLINADENWKIVYDWDSSLMFFDFTELDTLPDSVTVSIINNATITYHKLDDNYLDGKLIKEGTGANSEIFNGTDYKEATGASSHVEGYAEQEGFLISLTGDANATQYTCSIYDGYNTYNTSYNNLASLMQLTNQNGYVLEQKVSSINITASDERENPKTGTITLDKTLSQNSAISNSYYLIIPVVASRDGSHAEGYTTRSLGIGSHSEGSYTVASGSASHAEGNKTIAKNNSSHAEGYETLASGDYTHAEGHGTIASYIGSHAEGGVTKASNNYSHAEGYNTTASGQYSHAEGNNTKASNNYSHAEGYNTTANGYSAHAEGYYTTASHYAHAEGYYTTATGQQSHAEGKNTTAQRRSQHVFGEYNILDTTGSDVSTKGSYIEIVGNGTGTSARSNARTLDWSGNEILKGKLTIGTAPTNDMDVTTKQYVDTAIGSVQSPPEPVYYINITSTEQNNETIYAADKTFEQITSAYEDGLVLVCIYDGIYYSLNYKEENYSFDFCDASSSIYEYRINEWHGYRNIISIYGNNSISYSVNEVPIPQNIAQLTDTVISSPTNGQFLQYNSSTSQWENKTYTAPVTSVNGQTGAVSITVPTASSTIPSADGTGAIGTATTYARADHVHPKITQALSISSNVITLTGSDGTTSSVTLPVYNGGVSS